MSLQSFFIDNFDFPLVKKRGRKSTGTSASKGKSRRQTIDQSDLENFQNISELSISSNDKKKKDRRETIDPHDLLAFADSSVLSSNSGSSADPLDLQKAVLDDLSLSTADPTNTILSMKSQSMENSQRSAKSSKSKSSTKKGKGSDRRQTIDKVDLMNLIDLDFSCEVRDETISTTLPNDIPKSKDHRRETIDPVDLLDFSNSSGLLSQSGDSNLISKSVSLNSTPVLTCSVEIEAGNKSGSQGLQSNSRSKGSHGKKKKTPNRRETIDMADLLHLNESSMISTRSGSTINPTDVQNILDDLEGASPATTVTMTGLSFDSSIFGRREEESDRSLLPLENFLKIGSPICTSFSDDISSRKDEESSQVLSTKSKNEDPSQNMSELSPNASSNSNMYPVCGSAFSVESGISPQFESRSLSQCISDTSLSKSDLLHFSPASVDAKLLPLESTDPSSGGLSFDSPLEKKKRGRKSSGSSGKKTKTRKTSLRKSAVEDNSEMALRRRETIDPTDLLALAETSMLSTRSGSTINPTDVQNILDDLEGASPATTVTMTGLSFDSSIFGRREEESDRSLLPLENFLKIGSPIRANDAASGTTSKFSAAPTLPAFSSALKSCLSSKKPPRDFTISHTASKSVVFGSPQVAEFNKTSPTTKFTPMDKSQAKALFQHTFEEKEEVKEEVDDVTAENERILEEWDRLTQASDCSPQQLVEEDFPFEDFSNEDGSDLSRHHVSNSSMSSIKRRESMLQPHIFDSKLATAAALDCSELEEVEEFTTTVQLPSTLSALMEEVSLEQKKKGFRREEGDEDSTLDDVDEYDDHTEEIETDLRSLLHHIDEKHSFIDLRGDSSASHLADASSASVMPVQIEVEDEDNIRADKSPRKSLMSEIFPMDDGSLSSSNMLEISSAAQLDDDLHQIYQNTSSVSRTSEYSSKQSETEHSILSHLGDVHVEEVPFGSSVKIDLGEGIKIFEDDAVPNSEFENENVEIRVTPLVNNQLMEEVKEEEEEEEEMEELEEEESVEELSFIGRKAKLLLEEIQTPPHTAPSVTRSTVKAVDADQLTGLRQRLLSLKPSAVPMVTTTENDHVHRTISLSTQVEREVEKVEQKKSSMPRTPFSSKASSSVSAKKVSTKKKANTPLKLEPTPSITPSDTMKSQKSYPVISQPSAEEWDAIIFTQWCKVFTVVLKMTSLTRTLSSHAHYSTLTGYIHNLVEENFVVATRFMSHLSRFLTNQLSLLWQHYITLPSSPLPPSCESIYREQFAVASSSSYQELMENVRESMSEYYLLRHQSSQWESLWLELINSSLFEGIARLRNHHGTRDILPITANSDRFMAKALSVNAAEEIKGEKKASASQQLLDRIIRSKGEKRSQQMELQQKIKETMTKNSIINRFSFFRIVALLADLIEVQIFLSEEAKVILQFHLESSGKGEKAVVHGIESIDIDLSFSDAIKKSEKSFIATYFADVIASEQWKGPLNPNDLNELDKISDIHLLLEKLTGYVIALRAGLNIVRKIEKLDGSFSIVRDINSEDDAVTLPSVYIEYSHSQFPVTMTLMSFLSYAQDKTHAFISSQDSMLLFLKDLRDYMNIAMH